LETFSSATKVGYHNHASLIDYWYFICLLVP
jgi:hypothetical protein